MKIWNFANNAANLCEKEILRGEEPQARPRTLMGNNRAGLRILMGDSRGRGRILMEDSTVRLQIPTGDNPIRGQILMEEEAGSLGVLTGSSREESGTFMEGCTAGNRKTMEDRQNPYQIPMKESPDGILKNERILLKMKSIPGNLRCLGV